MEKTFDLIKQEYRNQSVEICRLIKEQYDSADKTECPKDEIQTTGSGNVKPEKKEDKKAKKEEVKKTPVKKNKKSIAATKTKIQKISSEINILVDEISSKSTLESKPAKYLTEAEFHERVTLAEMK